MISIVDTYQDGHLTLDRDYSAKKPVKLIVTFLEDVQASSDIRLQGFLIKTECVVLVYIIHISCTLWILPFVDKCAGRLVKHTQN